MDLHSFHIVAKDYCECLDGARIEKIHAPEPGVHVFSIFAQGLKIGLFLRHERKQPLMFVSLRKLENPPQPSAHVMRLRKYLAGRRLGGGLVHPTERRVAFPVMPRTRDDSDAFHGLALEPSAWLLLDLVNGPDILFELPEDFGSVPCWPPAAVIEDLCGTPMQRNDRSGSWHEFAVLTPLLRETLSFLDPIEGRALLTNLESGGGALFLYADSTGRPAFYSAWPLPEQALSRRGLTLSNLDEAAFFVELNDPFFASEVVRNKNLSLRRLFPAIYAASLTDERRFFLDLGAGVQKQKAAPEKKAAKKLARLLAKLDAEEKRLGDMYAQREKAIALQSVLWQYSPDARQASVQLPGGEVVLLNSMLTIRENMARMFHQSGRGKRGLAMLEERRAELSQSDPREAKNLGFPSNVADQGHRRSGGCLTPHEMPTGSREYKNVAYFTSSDGFAMLRGKNAKGNHSLLKIGKGHDLWLHVEEGPGAHVIIRRNHDGEQVPESTLMQAAALAAEKSWQGARDGVRIMYAQLRHVHPMKGAGPGMVKVDKLVGTLSLKER